MIRPIPFATKCRCGIYLFKGQTAEWYNPKSPFHCVGCRPRER